MIAHRKYIGPEDKYNLIGGMQFARMVNLGLKPEHSFLDIGAGSLRIGRFLMMYLEKGNYYGIEPNKDLVAEAIRKECLNELLLFSTPMLDANTDFNLSVFDKKFDFLLANSIFIHASLRQIDTCLLEAQKVMKKGSIFVFNYYPGEVDNKSEKWTYPGKVAYRENVMIKLLLKNGFRWYKKLPWKYPTNPEWIKVWKKA